LKNGQIMDLAVKIKTRGRHHGLADRQIGDIDFCHRLSRNNGAGTRGTAAIFP
jgi:hypothetical protein